VASSVVFGLVYMRMFFELTTGRLVDC